MRILLPLVVGMLLPACAVYKVRPDLDLDLSAKGAVFANSSRLETANPDESLQKELLRENSLLKSAVFSEDSKRSVRVTQITPKYPHGGKGFQCFEPYLLVLSLGLIPAVCEQEFSLDVEFNPGDGGPVQRKTIDYKQNAIAGWVALIFAPFPSWSFGDPHSHLRALYTEVNRESE